MTTKQEPRGNRGSCFVRETGLDSRRWASPRKEVVPMEQFLLDVLANVLAGVIVVLVAPYLKR